MKMLITFALESTGQGGLERPIVLINGERWFTRPIEVVHMLSKLNQELIVEVPDDKMHELRNEFNIPDAL